ncbi:MAG: hypothetical protein MRY76_00510 [Pseudomonadales bacterium]|nr:hypothetical protein [Pseudomonadales bacterium]
MSEQAITGNNEKRAQLLPVVLGIAGACFAIITTAYFVGNFINKIP